jgi:hypothetical protein
MSDLSNLEQHISKARTEVTRGEPAFVGAVEQVRLVTFAALADELMRMRGVVELAKDTSLPEAKGGFDTASKCYHTAHSELAEGLEGANDVNAMRALGSTSLTATRLEGCATAITAMSANVAEFLVVIDRASELAATITGQQNMFEMKIINTSISAQAAGESLRQYGPNQAP